jgi:hypothetical protein
MALHLARIGAIVTLVVVCMFLPVFPGAYDSFAVTLSGGAHIVAIVGLLLVPIGAVWLVSEMRHGSGYYFAIASIAAASLLAASLAMAALASVGPTLALCVATLLAYGLWRAGRAARLLKHGGTGRFNAAPLYLIVVPTVAFACWFLLLGPAIEFSRQRAIKNSAELIREIDAYHQANGRYPASLLALHQDYKPSVIGIERYYYEPNGEAYDLYFEQLSNVFGTREIVMYNARDEHSLPSHDSDLLRWTPEQLRARPGHYAIHDTSTPHWKYFWFD